VQLVIADTGPINYLIPIGRMAFFQVCSKQRSAVVRDELKHRKAPPAVRQLSFG
jgi:hypothetical protein